MCNDTHALRNTFNISSKPKVIIGHLSSSDEPISDYVFVCTVVTRVSKKHSLKINQIHVLEKRKILKKFFKNREEINVVTSLNRL